MGDSFRKLNHTEVTKVLTSVRSTTCPFDPCPSWLINSDDVSGDAKIIKPLQDIINLSLASGTFPQNLKEAVVQPLLKKSTLDPQDPANYRPVSNLPFLGKVIERAAANQLQSFLEDTLALAPFKSSFRPGHGVETALVTLLDDIRRHLDISGSALLVLLDLTTAFDTVDH